MDDSTGRLSGKRTTAAILAGGRARRLGGRDKSALVVGGRTILDRQLSVLGRVAARILFVTSASRTPVNPQVEVVTDLLPARGPLGGLFTALTAARGAVLVVAGDLPFLRAAFLEYLVALERPGVDAIVPRTPDGPQPLCAFYLPSALPLAAECLSAGSLAVVDLLERINVLEVPAEVVRRFDPGATMFLNVNTEADLRRAEDIAKSTTA